ncbi:MAG: hypothetical protein ABSG52_10655 [Terriglobales bacterium]|jgi:quercetin dioxygenase-like cupin family protein
MRAFLLTAVLVCLAGATAWAQQLPAIDDHAKVVVENDQVRVLRYHYEPGDKSKMHSHPDNVQIVLTDSHAKVYTPDGKVANSEGKAGEVRWRTAAAHSVENVGDKAFEGILVEMKVKPAGMAQELSAPDDHAKVVVENDQVRVLRYRYEPGDKSKMHSHPDNVQIVLTDSHAKVYTPDGKVANSEGKAGEVRWRTAAAHSVENVGDKAFEGILVEMKTKPAGAKAATGE